MAALQHSTARARRGEGLTRVPALGLTVRVRLAADPGWTVIETMHADRCGSLQYRREETEIFEILTGRYLFQVDGQRFMARRGDLVSVPGGAVRAFVNVTGTAARQHVFIRPAYDAAAYFRELDEVLCQDPATPGALRRLGARWRVEFIGAPLDPGEPDLALALPSGPTSD